MRHPIVATLALLAALSGVVLPAAPVSAATSAASQTGPACPTDGVRGVPLPGAATATLATDVAALKGVPVWIAGVRAGPGTPRRPWMLRATGTGWVVQALPAVGYDSGLMGVAASGPKRAWAVGFRTIGRRLQPVSLRWDGIAWRAIEVPSTAESESLVDVSIGPDGSAWTAGSRSSHAGPLPVVLHRVADTWVRLEPLLPSGWFGSLTALDAAAPDGPWAVGWMGNGGALRPLIVRWNGIGWERVTTGLAAAADTVVTGIDVAADGAVSVTGYVRRGTELRGLLWHRTPVGWVADPDLGAIRGSMIPDDLTIDGAGDAAIVGAYRAGANKAYGAFLARDAAGTWSLAIQPDGLPARSHLRAVLANDDDVFAAGWTANQAVAVETCGALPRPPAIRRQHAGGGRGRATHPDGGPVRAMHPGRGRGRLTHTGGTSSRPARQVADPGDRPDSAALSGGRSGGGGGATGAGARLVHLPAPVPASGIHFLDIAVASGIDLDTTTYGATALDIDRDGWTDLLISQHIAPARLLRNDGGTFVPAPGDPLPLTDRHGCAAADLDQRGGDEVFCAVGAARGMRIKANELWLNLDTAHPDQVAAAFGVDDPLARGRRATFLDLDGDPYPDLLVTSDPIRVDGLPSLVRAYRNDAGTGFVAAPSLGLELPSGGVCAITADLDGDGVDEVVLCTDERWGGQRGSLVFARSGSRFRDVTTALGVVPGNEVDAAAADLDGDGKTDLVQLSGSRLRVNLQRNGIQRRVLLLAVTAGTALAIGDADGDGDPDLYVVQGGASSNAPDLLLLNAGDGRTFTSVTIPQTTAGSADDVLALDVDHNGTDDFLVLNGAETAGPVQLIAGFR